MSLIHKSRAMDHSIFSTTAWIALWFSVLVEILLKDEQLITVFKVRVYTDIAYANLSKVPGIFFSYLTNLHKIPVL